MTLIASLTKLWACNGTSVKSSPCPGYIILVGVKELQSILREIIKLRTKTLFFPIIANLLLVMNTISARWGWDGGDI